MRRDSADAIAFCTDDYIAVLVQYGRHVLLAEPLDVFRVCLFRPRDLRLLITCLTHFLKCGFSLFFYLDCFCFLCFTLVGYWPNTG